jgi:programmed cell death protein 5
MGEEELGEIRRRKMQQLLAAQQQMAQEDATRRDFEVKKQAAIRHILAPEARERLNSIRMTRPEFVEQVELQLISLVQSGRINSVINDEQLRLILQRLTPKKREINIKRI